MGPGHGLRLRHIERKSVCFYSQLKACSASEVAAMLEGLLRHCTEAVIEANFTDTHGASVIGFASCHLLGFRLLPRLKQIGGIQLYRPDEDAHYPGVEEALTRPVRWELIEQQHDRMVKYATAMRLGTAEAEQVLRRVTRGGPKHLGARGAGPGGAEDLRLRVPCRAGTPARGGPPLPVDVAE